jgi:hypothetical protein
MRSYLLRTLGLTSTAVILLLIASPAQAQCGTNSIGFGDVGIVPQKPFQAEIVVTRDGPPSAVESPLVQHPRSVARDSDGRIRSEGVTGNYKHDTGPDAGTDTEQHMIRICDPIAQTLTHIDSLTSSARIVHAPPSAPSTPARPRSFCDSRIPHPRNSSMTVELLGTQTIEGVEARGVRIKQPPLNNSAGAVESSFGEMFTERWCSDELAAIVLTVSENAKTGKKTTTAMKNIERIEPDASLFQIPQDYSITETVAKPPERPTPTSNR